jgi:hypothetical protein
MASDGLPPPFAQFVSMALAAPAASSRRSDSVISAGSAATPAG